ncbi:MAG: hypothetical protein KDD11_23185 [Acidobacteria bacterium]|nr:hypothetical protein [Acidobacteriota bacterium]
MSRHTAVLTAAATFAVAVTGWLFAQSDFARTSDRVDRVFVTNLANPQPVKGTVEVGGTIRHGRSVAMPDATVSPAGREEVNLLTDGGFIDTDGFTTLVLSIQGQIKGRPARDGAIGVILLPEEEPFLRAFIEDGQIQLPLEAVAPVRANQDTYFSASEARLPIAFPRYHVLFYNSTDKTAAVNLFAYLTY